jgi:hypothetical protein
MRDGPRQPREYPVILIETAPVAEALNAWWSPGATLVFGDRDVAVWTAVHGLAADRVLMPGWDGAGYPTPLADLTGTIFVISRYDHAARDAWPLTATLRAPSSPATPRSMSLAARLRRWKRWTAASPWAEITVDALRSLPALAPGRCSPSNWK